MVGCEDREKTKPVIPESTMEGSVSIQNNVETPTEQPSQNSIKTKFCGSKNYFEGKGHSLRSSKSPSSVNSTNSGFRRISPREGEANNSKPIETRFTESDRNEHFKGTGHRLC